ncbi:hypothetical protein O6H91_01G156800 [Diphasiastrum complanatum]|uniref:Uncharacterized protein n=1 Tax=Diphasiastrum complanatum TaxID=34168 RepID=A0ACC2EXJ9_DIPCM|nr:hypothetical protein O6H91_Y398000 [Diphasiastrum complanatum]KAJ7571256.1 hypothetical protein O6H91_01G156800 [Diphasiastrum complanatum]
MALTNLLLTVVGVSAVWLVLRGDVRQSSITLRRNLRHIRNWLEHDLPSENGLHKPKSIVGEGVAKPTESVRPEKPTSKEG